MQLINIPESEQKDWIESFWQMLRECETKADNENDVILKRWVEGYYKQWNRVTKSNLDPVWVAREKKG